MHILDIIQNSIAARASLIKLTINEDLKNDLLTIEVIDNGQGMPQKDAEKITDPFVTSRKTREVGLGLPLLKAAAERCAGELKIKSAPGKGTAVRASFKYSHIDRAPLGDIVGTIVSLLATNTEVDFVYRHIIKGREFIFKTEEIKKELGEIETNDPQVLKWIEDYLRENLNELYGGD